MFKLEQLIILFACIPWPATAERIDTIDARLSGTENGKHLEGLRGTTMEKPLPFAGSYTTRKLTDAAVASSPVYGDCIGASTFLGIPFSASAYDVCTAFQDSTAAKLGTCGDPKVALDGQPNNDRVCRARAGVGGECHVAFTAPGEYLEYSFNINEEDHSDNAVFNIILRLAAKVRRTVRVSIDNGGDSIEKELAVNGTGFLDFKDVMWERVRIPARGPERIFVEFVDGQANFCGIRVEETTLDTKKELKIPFHASAQKYISFYELGRATRYGTCGPGAVDSQPTKDKICNDRGGNCNIGWTEAGEQVIYLVNNPSNVPTERDVTLRLASLRKGRRVMFQVEGYEETYMLRTSGKGNQVFEDFTQTDVTFPAGLSRLIVTFVDDKVNMCSISVQ